MESWRRQARRGEQETAREETVGAARGLAGSGYNQDTKSHAECDAAAHGSPDCRRDANPTKILVRRGQTGREIRAIFDDHDFFFLAVV